MSERAGHGEGARHRVLVLRHAKACAGDASVDDHTRPLASRGRRAASALAGHLGKVAGGVDLVLCSSARRAVETLDLVRPGLPAGVDVSVETGLYGASADSLLARLRQIPEEVGEALLIGHNPAVEDLVRALAGGGDREELARVREKYPTGGLATVAFRGTWADLAWYGGGLEAFVVPGDLEG